MFWKKVTTQKRHFKIIRPLAQCFLVLNVCSFFFVEKMACWSANVRIVEFFSSALEVLKIPSNSGFHKDFKCINKSSVGIKLREIFMISWFFLLSLSDWKLRQSKNWNRFLHHILNFVVFRNTELIQDYFFSFESFCRQ